MKKIIKKLFTPFAVFAMALGIGVSLSAPKEVLKTSAATHTVTITRSNFPSGALAYGTDDKWTATGTDGTALEGYFDLYATANQDNMQTRTKTPIGNYFHNTVAFPGPITKIELTGASEGASRQWTPFLSVSTIMTKSNYASDGASQGALGVGPNEYKYWDVASGDGFHFIYLNMTGGAAYLSEIKITYEVSSATFGTLSGINLNEDGVAKDFLVGQTFSSDGLVVQAYDDTIPPVTKFVSTFITDFDGVTFASSHSGTNVVTVSYTEGGVTVTATYNIVVTEAQVLSAINNLSGIHFGATYALGSPDNDVAMKAEHGTYFSSYTATYAGGNLVEEAITQLFTIEIGAVQNTFALKLTNGPKVGEYISYSGSSNALYTSDTLNNNSSWTIVFETDGSAVITNVAVNNRKIQYNSDYPRFAAYKSTTLLAPIKLFVADSTIDATVSADRLATEINDGRGNSAQGSCEELLGIFNGALNQLSTDAKSIFNTSTDAKYVNARARLAYLNSWVAAQPGSNPTRQSTSDQSRNNLVAVISIGAIGLTSILGYYFVSKKKKLS